MSYQNITLEIHWTNCDTDGCENSTKNETKESQEEMEELLTKTGCKYYGVSVPAQTVYGEPMLKTVYKEVCPQCYATNPHLRKLCDAETEDE